MARALIMWDGIAPNDEYLRSHIPHPVWQFVSGMDESSTLDDEDEESGSRQFVSWSSCYCLAGCVLALGISRAGHVHDTEARLFCLKWVKHFLSLRKSCQRDASLYVVETCLLCACLAASLVLCGSGDLEMTRIIRALHLRGVQNEPGVRFGSYMATSMCLGFLFMSGG